MSNKIAGIQKTGISFVESLEKEACFFVKDTKKHDTSSSMFLRLAGMLPLDKDSETFYNL